LRRNGDRLARHHFGNGQRTTVVTAATIVTITAVIIARLLSLRFRRGGDEVGTEQVGNAGIVIQPELVFLRRLVNLTVAPENGAIMAGRKGPAMWLRYGHRSGVCEPALTFISAGCRMLLPYGNFELPCGNHDVHHLH
jgi:hypothetical protein